MPKKNSISPILPNNRINFDALLAILSQIPRTAIATKLKDDYNAGESNFHGFLRDLSARFFDISIIRGKGIQEEDMQIYFSFLYYII